MPLNFVIRFNKLKSSRIEVGRAIFNERGRVEKYKTLGSLKGFDNKSIKAFIEEKELDEFEQYQLENYIASLNFNEQEFKAAPEELQEAKFIYIASKYDKALFELWKLAKKHHIAFCPVEIQLRALLHKAKAVEREINEKLNKPIHVLESMGVDIRRFDRDTRKQKIDNSNQELFKLFDELKVPPLEQLCKQFNKMAKDYYGKHVELKAHYLKNYANLEKPKRFPLWYGTVAIDLLLQHGVNPIKHMKPIKIVKPWLSLRQNKLDSEKAFKLFKETFKPAKEDELSIKNSIQQYYAQGSSTANS